MKRPLWLPLLITVALNSYATLPDKQTLANETGNDNAYFNDSERGWYWYEQLPKEEKEKFLEKIQTAQPQPPKPDTPANEEEVPLSTAWFAKNFTKYAQAAMDNPYDKEAMRTYLYLEKFMRDRAIAFGQERKKAVLAEPFLDHTSTRPIANFGTKTMNIQAANNQNGILDSIGSKSGIYYFYRSNDVFSSQQADLIHLLKKNHGFTILPVSMDGTPPPEILGTEFTLNEGQAESLGIQVIPAMYLYNAENSTIELISQGMQSLTELKERLLYASLRAGLIGEQEFQLTRPSGLYLTTDGYVSGGFPLPENAPETFLKLYNKSLMMTGKSAETQQ